MRRTICTTAVYRSLRGIAKWWTKGGIKFCPRPPARHTIPTLSGVTLELKHRSCFLQCPKPYSPFRLHRLGSHAARMRAKPGRTRPTRRHGASGSNSSWHSRREATLKRTCTVSYFVGVDHWRVSCFYQGRLGEEQGQDECENHEVAHV